MNKGKMGVIGRDEDLDTLQELKDPFGRPGVMAKTKSEPEPIQAPVRKMPKGDRPAKLEPAVKPVQEKEEKHKEKSTPREKAIRLVMRRAGVDEIPELSRLMRCKGGQRMRIADIGVFIGEPEDEVLQELAKTCCRRNRVNLSAEVQIGRVKKIGVDILSAGRMYQPVQVARIEEDGEYECTSGRHRVAFLAMLYGTDAEIPVYIEDMTIQEARDAVVVANQARATKALEKAEHAIMKAVHGDIDADQDAMYEKTATTKASIRKYCVYSVIEREYPVALGFHVSLSASRKGGAVTTVSNIENFWATGVLGSWHKDVSRRDFDESLRRGTEFLNSIVEGMKGIEGFDARQHLSAMVLMAVGKYYNTLVNVFDDEEFFAAAAEEIARVIVGLGECARYKSDEIFDKITVEMKDWLRQKR